MQRFQLSSVECCLLKHSRAGSKEKKIKSYWISKIYIGQWKRIDIIGHWLKLFPDCDVHSHHNQITQLHLEKKPKLFITEIQRKDSSSTFTNNSVLFKLLRGLRRQAYIENKKGVPWVEKQEKFKPEQMPDALFCIICPILIYSRTNI